LFLLPHVAAGGGDVGEEERVLWAAALATKLIHLPDEPAGGAKIGHQAAEFGQGKVKKPDFFSRTP
jgi:hypothetical protein